MCASTYEAARSLGDRYLALAPWRTVEAFQALRGSAKSDAISALARAYRQLRRRRRPLLGSRRPAPLPSPSHRRRRRQLAEGALYLAALLLRGTLLFLAKDRYDREGRLLPAREPGEILQSLTESVAGGAPVLALALWTRASNARRGERRRIEMESAWALARAVLDSPGERPDPLQVARLREAIARLSLADRRIAELLLQDLDPADIARRLGLTHGSAKVRCLQVRARLEALLRG